MPVPLHPPSSTCTCTAVTAPTPPPPPTTTTTNSDKSQKQQQQHDVLCTFTGHDPCLLAFARLWRCCAMRRRLQNLQPGSPGTSLSAPKVIWCPLYVLLGDTTPWKTCCSYPPPQKAERCEQRKWWAPKNGWFPFGFL